MKIVYANEELKPERLIVQIYGEPGVGKSSIGFTANKPLTLDFDHGAHRSAFRKDIAAIDSWQDIANITANDLADYETIVVDTVGRALDMLTASLIASNPKLATAQGGLTMSGYGALKAGFVGWLNRLTTMGKDVVLLAHSKEDRKADDTLFYRPDITGGSAGEIFKAADVIGFYHMRDGNRTIEFAPTDAWAGKDPAGLSRVEVPDFTAVRDFLGAMISSTKEELGNLSDESRQVAELVAGILADIAKAKSAKAINTIFHQLKDIDKTVAVQCKGTLQYRCKDLDLEFNKDKGEFVKKPKPKEEAATTQEAKDGEADPARDGKD